MENVRLRQAGTGSHQDQNINQNQDKRGQRIRDVTDRDNQQGAEDDGGLHMRFEQGIAKARAKQRNVQSDHDCRYKVQTLWADMEPEKQRDAANRRNGDIHGEAVGIFRIKAGDDQTEEPEDELDRCPENHGFPVVLQNMFTDRFIAAPEYICKQQFVFDL